MNIVKLELSQLGSCAGTTTVGEYKTSRSLVTDVDVAAFGARPGTTSESKSWTFDTDPLYVRISSGSVIMALSELSFTAVRYDTSDAPYQRAYVTFRTRWNEAGYRSVDVGNPDLIGRVRFPIEILESSGGVIGTIDDCYEGISCPALLAYVRLYQKDISPGLYDIVAGARIPACGCGFFQQCHH